MDNGEANQSSLRMIFKSSATISASVPIRRREQCVWDRIGQIDGQTVLSRAELHTGFNLIPVSGVGEAVGVEKKRGGSKEHSTKT